MVEQRARNLVDDPTIGRATGSLVAQVERRLFFSFADVNHNPFPAQLLGDVLMLRAAAILCVLGPRVARSGKFPNHGTTTAK